MARGRDTFDVTDFGARGDGTTDDTAAIQAAINACVAANGGTVYLPRSIYRATALTVTSTSVRVRFLGEGRMETGSFYGSVIKRLSGTADLLAVTGGPLLANRACVSIENIGFHGNDAAGNLLVLDRASLVLLSNISFWSTTDVGLLCREVFNSRFNDLYFNNVGTTTTKPAFLLDAKTGDGAGGGTSALKLLNLFWLACTGTELKVTGSVGDTAPSDSITLTNYSIERVTQTNNYPMIELDYVQNFRASTGRLRFDGGSDPSLAIKQSGTGTGYTNAFDNLTIDFAGSPTYVIDHTVGKLQLTNLAIIGTPATAQYHIGSSIGAQDAKVTNFYTSITSKRVLDDRTIPTGGELGKGYADVQRWGGTATQNFATDWIDWEFADAATSDYAGEIAVPQDAIPGRPAIFRLYWTIGGGLTGAIVWSILSQTIPNGGSIANASTTYPAASTGYSTSGANLMATTDIIGPNVNPGDLLQIRLRRLGSDAADTGAAVARLYRMIIVYEAQL